jgi:hypothetical protein
VSSLLIISSFVLQVQKSKYLRKVAKNLTKWRSK